MNDAILIEAVHKFVEDGAVVFSPTLGGVNNIVKKITLSDGREFILRVYNNGQDTLKVRYEHWILQQLSTHSLSFQIPDCILSKSGLAYVPLSDGSEASLFHLIPGVLPRLSLSHEIGKACGELTRAFANIEVTEEPQTPPYFEIYKVHHSIDRDSFLTELRSTSYDSVRESAEFAEREILAIEDLINVLLDKNLPQQLIHGDLHYDNVLVLDGKVTGVLDFEFCAMDWRAMDLAICLSKYVSEPDPLPYFHEVIGGYAQYVTLTHTEIEALADLGILRILSNIVYFVARAKAGEDTTQTMLSRMDTYIQRIQWLRNHKQDIVNCFST